MTVEQPGQGLEMFFDQSDATRFRQVRFGGYDKGEVDQFLVETERRVQAQQQRILRLEAQLAEAQQEEQTVPLAEPQQDIGHRAQGILQMAEEEGRQRKEAAAVEAENILTEARRQARELLEQAERDAEDVRLTTQAHADTLRARLERETGDVVARAGTEAAQLLERAHQQAAMLEQEAATLAERTREAALRDADVTRQEALTQAVQWRLEAEQTRSQLLTTLQAEHEEAQAALQASMAERAAATEQANRELAEMVAEAARIRSAAVTEADETRARMLRETEQQITVARQQARISMERNTERHNQAIEALRREITSLQQRRQAIVDQLSNLSAMVTATAGQFSGPDLDLDDAATAAPAGADEPTTQLPPVATAQLDGPAADGTGPDPETLVDAPVVADGAAAGPSDGTDQPQPTGDAPDVTTVDLEPVDGHDASADDAEDIGTGQGGDRHGPQARPGAGRPGGRQHRGGGPGRTPGNGSSERSSGTGRPAGTRPGR
ncbi:DivIVA domain-containing protein [Desertihabitans brevis]|uniref:Cell wall synthesis protein Wag31 n=1 Tax=Desertihabitans brevis TaxID=2268447 RepID=A0A367YYX9_9ACTN|nr:DivIVA domain-containing protein [Desertihabitans brevis]RCK71054.1 DivIVA domain-containing protein [Desertihabitans brevis]